MGYSIDFSRFSTPTGVGSLSKVHEQYSKLEQLQEKVDDFERVKQYVGAEKIDTIVENARELERIAQSRKHNRAYGMSR